MKSVAVVGTLDTKGVEFAYLKTRIEAGGARTVMIDTGIMGEPGLDADVSAHAVAHEAGSSLEALRAAGDRAAAIATMGAGAATVVARLYDEGRIQGVIALGGGQGTEIGAAALRVLPVGAPKLIVSTIAGLGGAAAEIIGTGDVTLMNSVVDISGLNSLSRTIIANAAGAIVGMVNRAQDPSELPPAVRVAITMFGVTSACVNAVRRRLETEGVEVVVFAATGPGDRAMEEMIADGLIQGVVDVTTSQVGQDQIRGSTLAGPKRLEVAGERGIPQVVSLGGLDVLHCWSSDDPLLLLPDGGRRKGLKHNASVTLVRPTVPESIRVGEIIARKLNSATGPVVVVVPTRGLSGYDVPGGPLHDPRAGGALIDALKANLSESIRLIEHDSHINDSEFARELSDRFLELLGTGDRHKEPAL